MTSGHVEILFLGASRLVGLLERFEAAGAAEGVLPTFSSIEDDSPWHAIAAARLARTVPGPRFLSDEFPGFLRSFVLSEGIQIVIPSVDSATVALARIRDELAQMGVLAVVSDESLCVTMHDKHLAESWFQARHLPVPTVTHRSWPRLTKPRFGSASRDITIFHDPVDFDRWTQNHCAADFLVQDFIRGVEYSIDAYVNNDGAVQGMVSRVRSVVSGGEAMVTVTQHNERVASVVLEALRYPGWRGPLVFQAIDDGHHAWLIECNPRFGSGVTCSIEAGLDMPRWILREHLGRPLPPAPTVWKSGLCMTRSRKDWFLWLSS